MIIHKAINIPQKQRRHNTNPPKRNTHQIHPPITFRKSNLPRSNHNLPRRYIPRYAWEEFYFFEEGGAGEDDGFADDGGVGDAEFELHGAADVVDYVGGEFGDEDVVVGCVADRTADDANGEG